MGMMCCRCAQIQTQAGGLTDSVFVEAEHLVWADGGLQDRISQMIGSEILKQFRSLMDAIYVHAFPAAVPTCEAFYREEGPPLRNLLSEKQIARKDRWLCRVLKAL